MNSINPLKLLQLKGAWDQFKARHPKLLAFFQALLSQNAISEGSLIEITVSCADGKTYNANLKLTREDMQLIEELKQLSAQMGQSNNP